jgi:hypothetical protein
MVLHSTRFPISPQDATGAPGLGYPLFIGENTHPRHLCAAASPRHSGDDSTGDTPDSGRGEAKAKDGGKRSQARVAQ